MLRSEYDKRAAELLLEYAKAYNPKEKQTQAAKEVAVQITFLAMCLPEVYDDPINPDEF